MIVEDVTLVSERLSDLCMRHLESPEVSVAYTLKDAKQFFMQTAFDLVLLDLNLNGQDGFELIEQVKSEPFEVIIITASPNRAVEAFDFGVLDFVSKPITDIRFKKAIDRFLQKRQCAKIQDTKLLVKLKGQIIFVPIDSVNYIQASGNYAQIYTDSKNSYLHDRSLEGLTIELPSNFIRVHRSYTVKIDNIEKVIRHGAGKYTAKLKSGDNIPISRGSYKRLFT